MGFSESSSEGRRKEIRFFRWVLLGSLITAVGMHLSSVPLLLQFVSSIFGDVTLETIEEPIEVIFVEEAVPEPEAPVTPPPPSEEATENEPAAAAAEDSAPPLRTRDSVISPPTAESIETVPTDSAIASETGVEGGEGAAGDAGTIGLVGGDGSLEGDPTEPVGPPNVQQRAPVQEVARARPPAARRVACNPCSTPDYPLSEQRETIQGQPVINIIFDANGNVVQAVVESTSGSNALDQAALQEALTNWRFDDPYRLGGQVSVEVPFVIEGTNQFDAAQAAGQREVIELPVQQSIAPVTPTNTGATPNPPTSPSELPASESAPAETPSPSPQLLEEAASETPPAATTETPVEGEEETEADDASAESPELEPTNSAPSNGAATSETSPPQVVPETPATAEPAVSPVSPPPQTAPTPAPATPLPSSAPGAATESPAEPSNEGD